MVSKLELPTVDRNRYQVIYTGPLLNQRDYEVYATLLKLQRASGFHIGERVIVPLARISEELGTGSHPSGPTCKSIWETLERLTLAHCQIKSGKEIFLGTLLTCKKDKCHLSFTLSKDITALFEADFTYWDVKELSNFRSMVSKWIYSFYGTHQRLIPVQLSKLRNMMGVSDSVPAKEFNRQLKTSLDEVKASRLAPFADWKIDNGELRVFRQH